MPNVINATSTGNGGLITQGDDSGILNIQTNETTAITVDASQNVGIGTTSPQQKLHIQGTGQIRCSVGGDGTSTQYWKDATPSFIGAIGLGTPGTADQSAFVFSTYSAGWSERMRIVSSGELVVGGTTAGGVGTSIAAPDSGGIYCNTATTGLRNQIRFVNPNGTVGSIQTNGSATAYNTSSDYRLKENITPMTGALAKVAQLKPVTYKWKVDGADGEGFIAHELAEVCSHAVSGAKDAVDENGNPEYQGIDVSFLVATLTAALQETKALIDTQAETINALTARIVALEGQ